MAKKLTEQDIIRNFEKITEFNAPKETITRDIDNIHQMLKEPGAQASPADQNVWRIIMQNKWTKRVSAAVIFIAILIGISNLPQSELSAAELLIKVSEKMANIKWAKNTSKTYLPGNDKPANSSTSITDVKNKQVFLVYEKGYLHQLDYKNQVKSVYRPDDNTMIVSKLKGKWVGPERKVKQFIEKLKTEGLEVKQSKEVIDGIEMTVIEYDETLNDINPEPDKYMSKMLFAGKSVKTIKKKLVINTDRMNLSSSQVSYFDPEDNPIARIVSETEIIESGPTDIYELGAPKDAIIINKIPDEQVKDIRKKISENQGSFTKNYVAVYIQRLAEKDNNRIMEALVIYCQGKKLRVDSFYSGSYAKREKLTEKRKDILQGSIDILRRHVPADEALAMHHVSIYDGLWQHKLEIRDKEFVLNPKQRRPDGDARGNDDLDDFGWRILWWLGDPEHMYEDEFSKENDLIAMELTAQGSSNRLPKRLALYVDPAKDYLYRRYIDKRILDAPWQIEKIEDCTQKHEDVKIYDIVEYAQTSAGKWYPKTITINGYSKTTGKKRQSDFNRKCKIFLIEENPKLQQELFDPQILE